MNTHVSRRGVIRTAAWSAPAVTVVAAAPAYAANSATAATLQLIAPTVLPFNSVDLSASQRTVTVRVLDSSSQPVPNATVNFSVDVTGGTWDRFYDGAGSRNDASLGPTAGVTTDNDGYATTSYGYSAPPAVPSTTTATFAASCGAAAPVQFVVGHLPLQALVTHARAQHGLALVGGKDKTRIRNATPPEFRDLLLSIAKKAQRPTGHKEST